MLPILHKQCIRANRQANLIYLNNPKVGCSTVKNNLWRYLSPETYAHNVDEHDLQAAPFSDALMQMDWVRDANIFTFVRHPYTRIVSAYLNKIHGKEAGVWEGFSKRNGLAADADVSFDQFIEIISGQPPEWLDPHWRPQHLNIMYPFVRPNFLGHMETMDRDLPLVLSRFLNTEVAHTPRKNVHKTGADALVESYFWDPGTRERFQALYEEDFAFFGYSADFDNLVSENGDPVFESHPHDGLALLQQLRVTQDPAAKREITIQLSEAFKDIGDRFTRDWVLHVRLEHALAVPERRDLIQDNIPTIEPGHDFLRKSAARISVVNGDWALVQRIASAALNG